MGIRESHNYDHSHTHTNQNLKPIFITFILNIIFALIEFLGFLATGSMILYSSSIHDIGDSTTLFATLLIERKANEGRNTKYTYGYRRYSLIGSIINYTILAFGSAIAIIASIDNLFHPEAFDAHILLYTSILGIIINLLGFKLVNRGKSITNRALAANLFADIANFIAIAISSVIILFTDFYLFDSIFSIIFSLYLIYHSVTAFNEIFKIVMQATPEGISVDDVTNHILKHDHIVDVHDVHIWDLDSEDIIFTAHIVIENEIDSQGLMAIKEHIRHDLEDFNINHSTIEVDTVDNAISNGEWHK